MKRKTFRAVVHDNGLNIIGERDTFAWNSAIRATEAILREHGRERVGPLTGAKPVVMDMDDNTPEPIYRRIWTAASGAEFSALVWELT